MRAGTEAFQHFVEAEDGTMTARLLAITGAAVDIMRPGVARAGMRATPDRVVLAIARQKVGDSGISRGPDRSGAMGNLERVRNLRAAAPDFADAVVPPAGAPGLTTVAGVPCIGSVTIGPSRAPGFAMEETRDHSRCATFPSRAFGPTAVDPAACDDRAAIEFVVVTTDGENTTQHDLKPHRGAGLPHLRVDDHSTADAWDARPSFPVRDGACGAEDLYSGDRAESRENDRRYRPSPDGGSVARRLFARRCHGGFVSRSGRYDVHDAVGAPAREERAICDDAASASRRLDVSGVAMSHTIAPQIDKPRLLQ